MKLKPIKKVLCSILSCLLIFSMVGCSSAPVPVKPNFVLEYGDLDPSLILNSNKDDKEENIKLPTYDIYNLPEPQKYESSLFEEKSSYYKEQLMGNEKKAFDAIYNSASELYENVHLEREHYIEEDQMMKVMNIIFMDCPELFYLNSSYTYETVQEGTKEYVSKIYFNYSMSPDKIKSLLYDNAKNKPKYLGLRGNNDLNTINAVIGEIETPDKYNFNSTNMYDRYHSSITYSKLLCYWLRITGIDATVVLGDIVSDTVTNQYIVQNKDEPFMLYTDDGHFKTVTFNYDNYWCWPIVKIDDTWYHLDIMYNYLLSSISMQPDKALWFAPDRLMSQTRLSYINEEILGIAPVCSEKGYQISYRNNYYILPHTEKEAIQRIKEEIIKAASTNKTAITFQFENEETLNYFINNIDEQIENFNKQYNNPIGMYEVYYSRDSLYLKIHNIIHNF